MKAFTPSQTAAVETLDRDLCVVAGAGSGKTAVLAERFAHLVLAGAVPVDRILTLTFTDKAAVEMRERVARVFAARGRADLRREVETAWVSTFHSFCARLLKENAIEAGVDPAFAVLTGSEADLLKEEAREEVVARLLAGDPDTVAPLARLHTGRDDLSALLGRLLDDARATGRPFDDLLAPEAEPPDPGTGLADLRQARDDLRAGMEAYTEAGARRAAAALAAAAGLESLPEGDPDALGEAAATIVDSVNLRCGGLAKENLRAVKEAAGVLLAQSVALRAAPVARALARLLGEVDAAYAARKAERGTLDFHDLERGALDLLGTQPEVLEEVRGRFDHLLVDEYQDTNPVQERLLALVRLPERLFVVGDPKQAIYGFRGADHTGFARAREAAAARGRVVPLRENFRSRPGILAFANAVLRPAFDGGGPAQVPWEPLVPGAGFEEKDRPSVEVHLVAPGEEGADTAGLRRREAALLARRLRALVEGEASITARDPGDRPRALGWGDAAVLLRATTDIKVYERALADADVPYQVVAGRGFYEAREVVDLACLLEAVENPRNELALAAALRSPFAGLDDDALLALAGERRPRGGTLADLLLDGGRRPARDLAGEMRRRLDRFREVFAGLRDLRRHGRLVAIVDRAVEATGYDLAALLQRNGRQRAANLRKVREQARVFEADGAGGLAEFTAALRRLRLREERETEAPLAGEDAVSLLTVHRAKGLEWPLVFLPDIGRAPRNLDAPVLLDRERAGISLRGRDGPLRTPGWETLAEAWKAREAAEAMRVFHVGITRAKEHLVLSAVENRGRRGPWLKAVLDRVGERVEGGDGEAEIRDPLDGGPGETIVDLAGDDGARVLFARTLSGAAPPERRRVSLLERHRKRFLAGRPPRLKVPKEERAAAECLVRSLPPLPGPADDTPYLVTVSALLDFEECPRCYWWKHRIGVPDRPPAPLPEDLRRDPAPGRDDEEYDDTDARGPVPRWMMGVAVHALLATVDLARDSGGSIREAATQRLREVLEEDPPAEAVAVLAGWIDRFRRSPVGREVLSAREVHREVPFLLRREGVLLRGQIDLLYRDPSGGWTVADYKASSPPRRREKRSRYDRQVRFYALAAEAVIGERPTRGGLVYLEEEVGLRETDLSEVGRTESSRLLARFAEGTAAGRYPPGRTHGSACPVARRAAGAVTGPA